MKDLMYQTEYNHKYGYQYIFRPAKLVCEKNFNLKGVSPYDNEIPVPVSEFILDKCNIDTSKTYIAAFPDGETHLDDMSLPIYVNLLHDKIPPHIDIQEQLIYTENLKTWFNEKYGSGWHTDKIKLVAYKMLFDKVLNYLDWRNINCYEDWKKYLVLNTIPSRVSGVIFTNLVYEGKDNFSYEKCFRDLSTSLNAFFGTMDHQTYVEVYGLTIFMRTKQEEPLYLNSVYEILDEYLVEFRSYINSQLSELNESIIKNMKYGLIPNLLKEDDDGEDNDQ